VTEYGRQKADAETRVLATGSSAVLRLTKVFGPWPTLLADWRDRWRGGQPVEAFTDLVAAPVPANLVAGAMAAIGIHRSTGVYHLSADADVSYFDIARHLARRFDIGAAGIRGVSAVERGIGAAAVPKHTTLDTRRLAAELGIDAPHVWSVVDQVTP
jgi:dTDP-4-dehydrorhamnose reductase